MAIVYLLGVTRSLGCNSQSSTVKRGVKRDLLLGLDRAAIIQSYSYRVPKGLTTKNCI